MKPENVLCVTRTGNRVKLIDFGLARRFDPKKKLQVMFGTPDFASPEVLSYDCVTPAADMWSVGVICYVLLSGLSPFMGNSDLETMTNVTKAIYDFDDESFDPISAEAKDFISKLLVKDPQRRLTPNQCLHHKWLARTPAKKGKATQLSKTKLKKYVVRRRWQKAVNAIMALHRMGAKLQSLQNSPGKKSALSPAPRVVSARSSVISGSSSTSFKTPTATTTSRTTSSRTTTTNTRTTATKKGDTTTSFIRSRPSSSSTSFSNYSSSTSSTYVNRNLSTTRPK